MTPNFSFALNDSFVLNLDFDSVSVGSAKQMSEKDILRLNAAYGCDGCGGNIDGDEGILNGTNSASCQWIVKTRATRGISIYFTSFQVMLLPVL